MIGPAGASRRTVVVAFLAAAAVSTASVAAVYASGVDPGSNDAGIAAVQKLASVTGPHALLKAFGIDPSAATPAFTQGPDEVSVAHNGQTDCLVVEGGQDSCYPAANVATGRGFSVTTDCSAGSSRSMTIAGFAPAATQRVAVRYSDGSIGLGVAVTDGAFLLNGTTPSPGAPYPASIEYSTLAGASVGTTAVPGGQALCLPIPS